MTQEVRFTKEHMGDIEEALAELFDADSIIEEMGRNVPDSVRRVGENVRRACYLLDRPWPLWDAGLADDATHAAGPSPETR